jgi:DNA-binding NtrC family response regulator
MQDRSPNLRVLVVGVERSDVDGLTAFLRLHNFDAHSAYSDGEAMDWCGLHKPQAVIAEMDLPLMTGAQLAYAIIRRQPRCKVLIISAQSSLAGPIKVQAGKHSFPLYPKPVQPDQILDFLAAV